MQGGAARLDWREIVNAKTLTLVADWFADLPDFQRARVRWAFADPIGRPNDPNLVSGSKYEALALRYTDLDRPVQRPKGGYGSAAHGLQALSADALASTAADEEWVPASSVEKKPLHELYTTKAHSESRIKPPEHGPYMRDWAERNLVSTTARFSLPHAPPLPLRVSFLMPVAKLFASILAPNAIARLERWAVVEQATQAQLDAFVEGLYSILATIDRLAGQTTQRRAFRKPELASTVSAKPVVGAYVPPSISAVSPAQKHLEKLRRDQHAELIAMAEQALRDGRVLAGNGGEGVKAMIRAHPFKSQAAPIGGVRVGALESSAQAAASSFTLQDRKNYAGKALGTNASEWARTTASFGRTVGDAPWHGDGYPPGEAGERMRLAAHLDSRPIVLQQDAREKLEAARQRRPAQAMGNVHGYAPPM